MSVQDFYYEWCQNIPEIMKPNTDQEYKNFADLVHRAMFYISLNDTHLQTALSDLKTPNPTIKTYFDETVMAESRRKCFQDIATSSSNLDSKGGVTISKWDASYLQKQTGKDTTACKSVRPKGKLNSENSENTHWRNSKWGNKGQKQNSNQNSDQKSNQNSTQNATQNANRMPNAKKGRYCTHCKTKTHDTDYCWHVKKGKSKQKHINSLDANNDSQSDQDQNDYDVGKFNALCAVDPKSPVIDSFATKLATHPLATTESLMTKLNLEGICHLGMEVDTAASHNIISEKVFDGLQKQLTKWGREKSKRLSRGVKIRLADGSMADQECPVVQLNVSTDLYKFSKPLALTFLVVKGPNNLVGRHSIARLWPTEFKAFKETTCKNYGISKKSVVQSNEIKSTTIDKN
ncbi:unnamed protein product, partial [Meganyctiphanes norvegica]